MPETFDAPFAMGVDLSMLQYIEDRGVHYFQDRQAKDPLAIFQSHGCNWVRLRLFLAPSGREGQVNTLSYTLRLARRVKQAGLRLLLDFHYSDAWADPLHQTIPAEWETLTHSQLTERVRAYTRETMDAFRREGCFPDMVEVGNEITNGFLWPAAGPLSDSALWNDTFAPKPRPDAAWDALADLLRAGIQGVRDSDASGTVRTMIHIDKGGSRAVNRWFFDNLQRRGVTFDVIGLSYYPFWHGTLADLQDNLAFLAQTYGKDIMVVETGYDWDGGEQGALPFPPTPDGQKAFLGALLQIISETPENRGRGLFYWAPEWIQGTRWDGPDWSPTWEHRALFDHAGNALPAMQAFQWQGR